MSHETIDSHFLQLLNHGDQLLRELRKGDVRHEGHLKTKIDAYAGVHSQAMAVASLARVPQNIPQGNVFDGGPESNPPGSVQPSTPDEAQMNEDDAAFMQGADLARADHPLPADASTPFRRGYFSIKPQFGDPAAPKTQSPGPGEPQLEEPPQPESTSTPPSNAFDGGPDAVPVPQVEAPDAPPLPDVPLPNATTAG